MLNPTETHTVEMEKIDNFDNNSSIHSVLKALLDKIINFSIIASIDELNLLEDFLRTNVKIIAGIKQAKFLVSPPPLKDLTLTTHEISLDSTTPETKEKIIPREADEIFKELSNHPEKISFENSSEKNPTPSTEHYLKVEKKIEIPDPKPKDSVFKMKKQSNVESEEVQLQDNSFTIDPDFTKGPSGGFSVQLTQVNSKKSSYVIIVDDIEISLFGECKRCSKSLCGDCKKKGGIRTLISGFLPSEQPFSFIIWTDQFVKLLKIKKSELIRAIKENSDNVIKKFLTAFKGRLLYISGYYKEYRDEKTFNAVNCYGTTFKLLSDSLKDLVEMQGPNSNKK